MYKNSKKFLFISSKYTVEERKMYLKSKQFPVKTSSNTNDSIKTIRNCFLLKYQNNLFGKIRCNDFVLDCVGKTYCKDNVRVRVRVRVRVTLQRCGLYIKSSY